MNPPSSAGIPENTGIDWNAARRFLHERLSKALDRVDPTEIQDLTQEALLGLLRAVRREPPRNLEALMTTIARRTGIDFIRQRRVWRGILTPMEESHVERPDPRADEPEVIGDPAARLGFVVLEFFRVHGVGCHDLARYRLAGMAWKAVAEKTQRSHAAVRKQWERCTTVLRKCMGEDDGLLSAWTRAEG